MKATITPQKNNKRFMKTLIIVQSIIFVLIGTYLTGCTNTVIQREIASSEIPVTYVRDGKYKVLGVKKDSISVVSLIVEGYIPTTQECDTFTINVKGKYSNNKVKKDDGINITNGNITYTITQPSY